MEIIIYCKAFIIGMFFTLIIFFTGAVLKDKKPINKVHFYVARDKDGKLFMYEKEPLKDKLTGQWTLGGTWGFIPKKLFPEVQWTDKESTKIKLVIDK